MVRSFLAWLPCGLFSLVVAVTGCDVLDTNVRPPPVPEGFPQPDKHEDARAELVVDGERYVTDYATGASYNVEGGFEDEIRGTLDLDRLSLAFRELEPQATTIESGDLTARWNGSFEADTSCGDGELVVMGLESYDSGLLGERDFIWGTVQLELCEETYGDEVGDRMEVTGRFTAVVDYY